MDGKPTGPAPARSAGDGTESDGEEASGPETFGVLELRRERKADGRALLVFRRSAESR
jgi:hypothetical protein